MNDKDLNFIRKQFKLNRSLLRLENIYMAFINNQREVINNGIYSFDSMDEDNQELIIKGLKKVFTGNLDVKIFEKEFIPERKEEENSGYKLLTEIEKTNSTMDFSKYARELTNKIAKNNVFDGNIVVSIVKGNIIKDSIARNIVIGSIFKAEQENKKFIYDVDNDEFGMKSDLNSVIQLDKPIDGFSFPVLEYATVNRNKVLYYSRKANSINPFLVNNVLGCDIKLTAKQEKDFFNSILQEITGEKVSAEKLYQIYNGINVRFEEEEDSDNKIIGASILKKIFNDLDIEPKKDIEEAFNDVIGSKYEFKVNNILPNYQKKSIKITNDDTDISIRPDGLKNLHQVQNQNGELFLLVPISNDVIVEEFGLKLEKLEKFA